MMMHTLLLIRLSLSMGSRLFAAAFFSVGCRCCDTSGTSIPRCSVDNSYNAWLLENIRAEMSIHAGLFWSAHRGNELVIDGIIGLLLV